MVTVTTTTARPSTTDISPIGLSAAVGATLVTPYREQDHPRVNGMLKQGKTRIAEITDGTSNTICHRRGRRSRPALLEPLHPRRFCGMAANGVTYATTTAYLAAVNPNDPGPAGGEALYRRYWRWAEPDEGFGVSGAPNNKFRPDHEASGVADRRYVRCPGQQRRQQRRARVVPPRRRQLS